MENLKLRLTELLEKNPELHSLQQLFQQRQQSAWLVGGCLRDMLLSQPVFDIDIAAENDPTPIAKAWAEKCHGRWFWLDADRQQSRVLLPSQLFMDFTPLRAATIEDDQKLRDFTINSMALPLVDDVLSQSLLDPLKGLQDLEQRTLKFCSSRSIADDPLRMLKGVRHAVTLQMHLSEKSLQQIISAAPSIACSAGERVRDELGKIMLAENPVAGFELLQEAELLPELFGSCSSNWASQQTFADMQQFDLRMREQQLKNGSEGLVDEPYSSRSLFLLATFFRAYRPANLPDLLHTKLRLSRQQQRIILSLQKEPEHQWVTRLPLATSVRQKALLVETLGYFPAEQMIYWSLYRQLISLDRVYDLLTAYHLQQHLGRVPDLLDGDQLAELCQLSGKEIGVWLLRIKQAELAGEISDPESAIRWLQHKISI